MSNETNQAEKFDLSDDAWRDLEIETFLRSFSRLTLSPSALRKIFGGMYTKEEVIREKQKDLRYLLEHPPILDLLRLNIREWLSLSF